MDMFNSFLYVKTRPGNGKTRLLGRGTRFPIKDMDL